MTTISRMPGNSMNGRLASPLVGPAFADDGGGGMARGELTRHTSGGVGGPGARRVQDRRRGPMALLTAATSGLAMTREPHTPREKLEQELRTLVRAQSVVLREDGMASGGHSVCIEVPGYSSDRRARLEVTFEPGRHPDAWTQQLLEAGAHIAALLLEVERAQPRSLFRVKPPDGAAPLIGSSHAIRTLRDRIERVAATDFTVLVEGASGPQPHPSFIDLFCPAPLR